MTALNATLFTILGTAMEILPRAVPAWFPNSAGGEGNASAAWLMLMGAIQIAVGAGLLAGLAAGPASSRLKALVYGRAHDGLALPAPRGIGR
ncbi:MAG TPA: hypothetical protein VGG37_06825 [Opitutaceae bacterium]|jgi:hypothetical protein